MNSCKITVSNKPTGKITPIFSKSTIHRSLICALLVRGKTEIKNIIYSEDVETTLNILRKCGAKIFPTTDGIIIDSTKINDPGLIMVNESGSTLRFIVPVLLHLFAKTKIEAKAALRKRPHDVFLDIFKQSGISTDKIEFPLLINGKINSADYQLRGDVSSQFISGLLFVLPLLENDSTISFTTTIESRGYIDLTIEVLKKFGIKVDWQADKLIIEGKQKYLHNITYENEIDASNYAYWIPLIKQYPLISLTNPLIETKQPDAVFSALISSTKPEVSVAQCPDLLPILATYFAIKQQEKVITGTKRTKIKESNRLVTITEQLQKLGYNVTIAQNDNLIIEKGRKTVENPIITNGANDHRIVMSMAIAAILLQEQVIIDGYQAVNKSDPYFWQKLENIGIEIEYL